MLEAIGSSVSGRGFLDDGHFRCSRDLRQSSQTRALSATQDERGPTRTASDPPSDSSGS